MTQFQDLIIFELANNHSGDVEHGKLIVSEFSKVAMDFPEFRFAFKFQYRDLDTFIHPDYQGRMDIKYIKRFTQTRLTEEQFGELKKEVESHGHLTMCTPFDEASVERIVRQKFDFLKIASCSFDDWPLLEKAAKTSLPMVISTAGATLENIDRVVTFLQHRDIAFCLMHCVGSYPTPDNELEMNQIDFFRQRYPDVVVGFSTHENPENTTAAMIAVAKGAAILERHIGIPTDKYPINDYSSTPSQIRKWLRAIRDAKAICGVKGRRRDISPKEAADLQGLQRGAFLARDAKEGERITINDLFFAIPKTEGQLRANDMSKYLQMTAKRAITKNAPLLADAINAENISDKIVAVIRKYCDLLRKSGVRVGNKLDFELSHHYGIDRIYETGCAIITIVNREYCKKLILVLPGQRNPTHTHFKKEETFHVLYGNVTVTLGDKKLNLQAGELAMVERGVPHDFSSETGCVLEEVSTQHQANDSIYDDKTIAPTEMRKTYMTFYSDWITKGV